MQIFVKTLTGKTIVLECNPTDTCSNIKQKIQDIEGIPVAEQNIIFDGVIMPDEQLALDAQKTTVLFLIIKRSN